MSYCRLCKTSVVKVWMENVDRFDSDEKHQAQEGYEWISADVYWAYDSQLEKAKEVIKEKLK